MPENTGFSGGMSLTSVGGIWPEMSHPCMNSLPDVYNSAQKLYARKLHNEHKNSPGSNNGPGLFLCLFVRKCVYHTVFELDGGHPAILDCDPGDDAAEEGSGRHRQELAQMFKSGSHCRMIVVEKPPTIWRKYFLSWQTFCCRSTGTAWVRKTLRSL